MTTLPLDLLMFAGLCLFVLSGAPIAFVLAGTAALFAGIGWWLDVLNFNLIGAFPMRVFNTMNAETLIAIPLFVFMGMILERARIAEDLLRTMGALFGRMRGGLGVSVTLVGALLAASTGIVGATTVTMGMMALPVMLRYGYGPAYSSGIICSAGTLGQIIPPSTVLIIMGEVLSSAYQQAQQSQGNFAAEALSVGQLFAGSLLPGLMLVGIYIVYQLIVSWARPDISPALPREALEVDGQAPSLSDLLRVLVPPLALIVAVLGSILGGIATATEAASVGAVGATLLAGLRSGRKHWAVWTAVGSLAVLIFMAVNFDLRSGRSNATELEGLMLSAALVIAAIGALALFFVWREIWRGKVLGPAMGSTARTTSMIFTIVIGALLFSLVFRGLGGDLRIKELLEAAPGGPHGAMLMVLVIMFFLGMFLDYVEITIIAIPVMGPPILASGIDPIWFGVMIAMVLQTSFLTPPVGYTLAYLRSVAPPSVTTQAIWLGAVPFIGLQLLAVVIIYFVPAMTTWLPDLLF
ncbi:TRAP transporter large permease [Pararhodobacter oceanensis]|uniref:TRAP transporter large permease n=1 Tax=Pararhodobacter oceanensis TaxID=2172121 RepID=UPI003A8FED80